MKVWITKYALTKGIIELDDEIKFSMFSDDVIKVPSMGAYYFHGKGKEWHDSKESANARVLKMIAAKRKSVAKTLAKLDKLEEQIKGEHNGK